MLGEIPRLEGRGENITEIDRITWKKSFEYIYANLSSLYREVGLRSCVLCSVDGQEDQESIALQLATTAATTGKKVLLVDANLQSSQLHEQINLSNTQGLSNILSEDINLTDIIQHSQECSNLDFISSGTSTAQTDGLLLSPKMKQLVREFKIRYDLVIYSPSAFYESTEISSLGSNTDGIILVVQIGSTPESAVREAVNQMRNLRLPILGIIAAEVPPRKLKIPVVSSCSNPPSPIESKWIRQF